MLAEVSAAPSNGVAVAHANGNGATAATNGAKAALVVNGSKLVTQNGSEKASTYFGHNREEVTRILIQALSGMGYQQAAELVSRDSGFELESPTVAAFRTAVLDGQWADAEALLGGAALPGGQASEGNGLVLAAGANQDTMRFWLRQQKFLELLETHSSSKALLVLRTELTPLGQDTHKLHFLSSLLMCSSPQDLKAKANWDGAAGESRKELLSDLSQCISPSVMLPENRLAVLLQHVKQGQIDNCIYHTQATSPSLYSDHMCDRRHFPSDVALELNDDEGEVWQVRFSNDGSHLAACGSGESVIIWDTKTFRIAKKLGDHNSGVGNICWSPDDSMLITCGQDNYARLWDFASGKLIKVLRRFDEPVAGCVWSSDNNSFVVGTLAASGLFTCFVDREEVVEWKKPHRVQDICGSPDGKWIVAADEQKTLHIYDAETRQLEYDMELNASPTSVNISQDSQHILVNKRDGEALLIDLNARSSVQKFLGHTGGECQIRGTFGGANESFVACGSEDGNILIWHKNIGAAVERLPGHLPRCNAVAWNPTDPCMLASCGDDNRVKIWTNKTNSTELRLWHSKAESANITTRHSNGDHHGWRNPSHETA